MTMPEPAPSFVLVGWGYRSRAWWEAARGIGATCAGIVVRSPRETPVPSFGSIAEAVATTGARFVVSSVGWTSAAAGKSPPSTRMAVKAVSIVPKVATYVQIAKLEQANHFAPSGVNLVTFGKSFVNSTFAVRATG